MGISCVTFPRDYTVVQAAAFAKKLHCLLAWRGDGFVLLRVHAGARFVPRRPQRWQRPRSPLS